MKTVISSTLFCLTIHVVACYARNRQHVKCHGRILNLPNTIDYLLIHTLWRAEAGSGKVEVQTVGDETTKTGAPKETFGEGRAAQSEAGKKGGAISGAPSQT